MTGARMRPLGNFPVVNAVTICCRVQLPSPVCLSGVKLGATKTPSPGIAKPTSEPPRYLFISGLPKKYPGVWQSLHPPKVTRYLPRSTRLSAPPAFPTEITMPDNNSTGASINNRLRFIEFSLLPCTCSPADEHRG